MKILYLAYQDQATRQWAPVARVSRDTKGVYHWLYTKGARRIPGFSGLGRMNNLEQEYVSADIFPVLANRVLPKNRPEYEEYLGWLGLTPEEHDHLEELARTGGLRATDSIELIPCPEPNDAEQYEVHFFTRGLSHLDRSDIHRVSELRPGDQLYLMSDFQNEKDPKAILLRTRDPISIVGYAPMYYAHDFAKLSTDGALVRVEVDRVNVDAPLQYRLLCRITAPWSPAFSPCNSELFEPFSS